MDPQNFPARRSEYRGAPLDVASVAEDPIDQFGRWFTEMLEIGAYEPEAMALATDGGGQPSVRFVLLRGFDARGFVWYTNLSSRKSRELAANPQAALAWHWPELDRQVRAVGAVEPVGAAEADAYFATRPVGSQIGAWASPQSEVLPDRAALEQAVDELRARFGVDDLAGGPASQVPRPPHWGGWRIVPVEMEFWQGRRSRLHDRVQYRRVADAWERVQLAP